MDTIILAKLDAFFEQYPSHTYKKGDIVIQANSTPSGIFYIQEGIIRSYYLSEEGSEITLNMYKPHTFLPMSWAIANVPNIHFYEAMTNVAARRAPKEAVLDFIKKEPDVMFDLLRRVYVGMEGLWMHIELLTTGSSYTKLIASLVILTKRFGKREKDGWIIDLKMGEQDIANYAGMSRETASRELQKLKKENLVIFDKGTILVRDIQKLENILLR